ncbi:HAD family hydrolase [Humibacter ginsenosidimutans]|uniref:HAD family hydrolase n=1 Tax=Humibacter ginsenosidimutans TaxID=2599293 RepID=A0A5B8M0P9_9MICO|nr:HAD family hydrolase [Humibacter ginsenosidimutans]QDZ14398.1 HAD family hydrolase [Humibacter ginsenosidimutans]
MSGIDAVCFDLDGTLLRDDHLMSIMDTVATSLAGRHPGLVAEDLRASNRRHAEAVWRDWEVAWCRGESPLQEISSLVWTAVLGDAGIVDADSVAEACRLQEQLERESWRLYDESIEVVHGLRERGIRVAVITNGPSEFQRAKLETVGMTTAFDAIVVSGDRGIEKPRPEIFETALSALGAEPSAALHIGDSRSADVVGAHAAGMAAVWLDRSGIGSLEPHQHADAVVTDLRGLYPLLS